MSATSRPLNAVWRETQKTIISWKKQDIDTGRRRQTDLNDVYRKREAAFVIEKSLKVNDHHELIIAFTARPTEKQDAWLMGIKQRRRKHEIGKLKWWQGWENSKNDGGAVFRGGDTDLDDDAV